MSVPSGAFMNTVFDSVISASISFDLGLPSKSGTPQGKRFFFAFNRLALATDVLAVAASGEAVALFLASTAQEPRLLSPITTGAGKVRSTRALEEDGEVFPERGVPPVPSPPLFLLPPPLPFPLPGAVAFFDSCGLPGEEGDTPFDFRSEPSGEPLSPVLAGLPDPFVAVPVPGRRNSAEEDSTSPC